MDHVKIADLSARAASAHRTQYARMVPIDGQTFQVVVDPVVVFGGAAPEAEALALALHDAMSAVIAPVVASFHDEIRDIAAAK